MSILVNNIRNYGSHLLKSNLLITCDLLEDVTLLGITSALRAYKLAWLINQTTGIKLAQAETLSEETAALNKPSHITYFSYRTAHCAFKLIKNEVCSREGDFVSYLVPRLKQFDFFFVTQDSTQAFDHEQFCAILRSSKQVIYINFIPPEKWLQNQTDLLQVIGY